MNYEIKEIGKNGNVRLSIGDTVTQPQSKPGQYFERIIATGTEPKVQFRCNTDCIIAVFKIVNNHSIVEPQRIGEYKINCVTS